MRIAYTKPSIGDREIELVDDAIRNGWGPHCYDYLNRFERDFAAYLGVQHAIATSSCTGALHMGLSALGVGPGDEVVLADTNWIATVAPVVHLGATPVFVDILPSTWCLDPGLVREALTPRTRAIIATHLYGNLADMTRLRAISTEFGIPLVEDAAEAIGSTYFGEKAGSMGAFGTFSFHGTKTMTTGEGGMFVTNDDALYERVLTLSNHGRDRSQRMQFWPDVVGFKYKMANVQAAMGCGQLERVKQLVGRKQEILAFYENALSDLDLVMNHSVVGTESGAWMPNVVFSPRSGVTRELALEEFSRAGIDARVFFYPLSDLPMFQKAVATPIAHDIASRSINLPSFHDISELEMLEVVEVVKRLAGAPSTGGSDRAKA